jgi:putative ABC transport system permease protein
MERVLREIRYAFRQFRESLGFSATAVLMLALGIAATTATFSVVEGVLLRPLPFRDPGRLVSLGDVLEGTDIGNGSGPPVTPPEISSYTRDTHTFENLGGYTSVSYELSGAGEPSQVNASRLTAGVFPTLGVSPFMGHVFTQKEDEDSQQVAVVSYSLWQSRLHGDPHVLGAEILLDRKPYIVIGVMPRNFEFPLLPGHLNRSELWVPMSLTQAELTQGVGSWGFQMVGRLKGEVTVAQAQADADHVARETMRNFPSSLASIHISAIVHPLQEDTVADARPLIRILFLAVGVVLLIACANLAGLLLVRAIRRRREIGVRLALGASTAALLRQSMLESLALSVTGGVLGIGLAAIAIRVSISQLPETLPRISEIGIDWTVVAFALLLALMTGILCSLAPAFAAIRTDLNECLKEGGRGGSAGGGHARLRSTLVVVEIAIALVLVTSSGLLLRSFEKMRAVALGFRPEHVVIASYSLPRQQYASQSAVNRFNDELLQRLNQLPGAQFVGLTSALPMSGSNGATGFVPEGYVPPQGANMSLASVTLTVGNYFPTMKIPLLRGRVFTEGDKESAPLVVVINHKLAQHYWPGQDPVGKRLRLGTRDMKSPWLTIIGEVADVKQDSPDVDTQEQYYEPVEQYETSLGPLGAPTDIVGAGGYIAFRTSLPPEKMENAIRSTVRSLDPQLALAQVQTMEQAVSDSEAPRRFNTAVIAAFAGAAVLLAVLGIYSVVAFSVELRVREIAIRMALGSQRKGIVRLILRAAVRLAAFGCLAGVLGSHFVSRVMDSLLFQVNPFDPLVLGFAALALLFLVMAASAIPAIQAASINPMEALRTE